jgi:hypothetical protein
MFFYKLTILHSPSASSTELPTRIPAPLQRRSKLKRRLHQELPWVAHIEHCRTFSPTILQQWSGPSHCSSDQPELAVAVAVAAVAATYSYLATAANAGIGWRGRVLSCNSNLRVPCIGFESISFGCNDSLVKSAHQSLQLVHFHIMVAPVLIDAREPN